MTFSLKKPFNGLHFSRQHTSPFSGWVILIVLFCIVNIIQLALIVHVVMNMAYGETSQGAVQIPPVETVERGRLEEVIADFTVRQNRFESLQTSYSAPRDPSL